KLERTRNRRSRHEVPSAFLCSRLRERARGEWRSPAAPAGDRRACRGRDDVLENRLGLDRAAARVGRGRLGGGGRAGWRTVAARSAEQRSHGRWRRGDAVKREGVVVAHATRGRVRLLAGALRGRRDSCERVARMLARGTDADRVIVRPTTGSVIVERTSAPL